MKIRELIRNCMNCLKIAHKEIERLGEQGRRTTKHARSSDISTKADVAVSKVIVKYLKERNVPAILLTEELGQTNSGEKQDYTVVVDDIDGTKNYQQDRGRKILPYCTLIAAFEGTQPKYSDILFAAVMEHNSCTVWHAVRGEGFYVNGIKQHTGNHRTTKLKKTQTGIIIDHYMSTPSKMSGLYDTAWVKDFGSSALHYALVADGTFQGFVSDGQKQRELSAAYLFTVEAGKWISDFHLKPVHERKYECEAKMGVIIAETPELAREIKRKLGQNG